MATLASALLAGCSGQEDEATDPITPPPATPSPTTTVPAGAEEALAAYQAFQQSLAAAQANPTAEGEKAPADADVTQWSWDPLQAQMVAYVADLAAQGAHYEGTQHQGHPRVESVDLEAESWPTVVISDCAIGGDWHPVAEDGTRFPEAGATATPPPPYRITVTMIEYQGRWGASEQSADRSSTCTP
ncbi:hypothetical protein LWF15_11115 [Kineosporia rhizophila]|uniref:hypothetical protein n=1 Tax=Kineosporia rhizophila TaxID=84633 RepID=UPI001E642F10|nr:hypothetical protein [Kineosporia rhizophila]MCE0536060.1 hypothetical protein [Kineosporia rhizophila]